MREAIVEVEYDGKPVKVVVGEISWRDAQKLIGESMEIVNGQSRIRMDILRVKLVEYAIKRIEGVDKVSVEKFIDGLNIRDGNKILAKVLELNPLEEITAV